MITTASVKTIHVAKASRWIGISTAHSRMKVPATERKVGVWYDRREPRDRAHNSGIKRIEESYPRLED